MLQFFCFPAFVLKRRSSWSAKAQFLRLYSNVIHSGALFGGVRPNLTESVCKPQSLNYCVIETYRRDQPFVDTLT